MHACTRNLCNWGSEGKICRVGGGGNRQSNAILEISVTTRGKVAFGRESVKTREGLI